MAVSTERRVKQWLIGSLFAGFGVVFIAAFLPPFLLSDKNTSPCSTVSDGDAGPIPFKKLSDEDTFPFITFKGAFIGTLPSLQGRPDYDEYRAAIARFPDIRSCLMNSQREKQIPNLNRFDWNKIEGTQDAEVCLFRLFSSIGNAEESYQWLKRQGFETELRYAGAVAALEPVSEEPVGHNITANWSIRKCGDRFDRPSLLDQLLGSGAYGFWVGTGFTPDGEVGGINAGFDVK